MAQPHYHARLGPVLGHFGEDAAGRRLRLDARVSGSADGTDIRYDHGPAWGKNVTTTAATLYPEHHGPTTLSRAASEAARRNDHEASAPKLPTGAVPAEQVAVHTGMRPTGRLGVRGGNRVQALMSAETAI